MDRRAFLKASGGAVAGAATINLLDPAVALGQGRPPRQPALPGPPFTLGVASGDPTDNGVVLWTRLAPDPLVPGGGMPPAAVRVDWEVARDEAFRRVVRRGHERVVADEAHTAHVDVRGLHADSVYWYRFRAGGEISQAGRTRTAPRRHARPRRVRFATASCQDFQAGFYTAHQALAAEDLAFVLFLGDYIYEGRPNPAALRQHDGVGEPVTLDEYRARHARYRGDVDLQAAHAAFPWIVTFDDHELDNNWADEIPQDPGSQSHDQFMARRVAALHAYWEHMPLPRRTRPVGPDMPLYRRLGWGDLLQVDVLDTRQYRSDQPPDFAGASNPAATMLGAEQEAWLSSGLRRSRTRWNCLAQQTMVAQNDRQAGPGETFDFDNWDGYRVPRQRLLADLAQVDNPVVVTGDRHATWVCDLKQDFYDPASATVGAELTGTSISSGGDRDPAVFHAVFDPVMVDSPHWKFIDNRHGYLVCDLDRHRWLTDLRTVDTVLAPQATVATFARFVTEAGVRGVSVA
ncbi:MAG: alkaline phosphatase D family protein [Acidimicrobiales bacterium]